MAQRKLGSIKLMAALSVFCSINAVPSQATPLEFRQLPLEIQRHITEVRSSCRELNPETKFYSPLQGVTIIDLEGDGSTDFLVDNEWLCSDHMPGANCTNRGCDLLIWQQRQGQWRKVFEEHLYAKFISIDDHSRRLQMMTVSIYAGDPRCTPDPNIDYTSGESCDAIVIYKNGDWEWNAISHIATASRQAKKQANATGACYQRSYTRSHLNKHPDQLVTSMFLLVQPFEPKPRVGDLAWGESSSKLQTHAMRLAVTVRGQPGTLRTSAPCYQTQIPKQRKARNALSCEVECDGGGIVIESLKGQGVHVHLGAPIGPGSISLTSDCGQDGENTTLNAGKDDKIFRLDKADYSQCKSLIEWF